MEKKEYWSLHIQHLPAHSEDEVAGWLFENGAGGVHQELAFDQTHSNYVPTILEQNVIDLVAYFEVKPREGLLSDFSLAFPAPEVFVKTNAHQDWQGEWKKQWKPFPLVENFWVVPSWLMETFKEPGARPIVIDPGMAFGTGTHATTQIASRLIFQAQSHGPFQAAVDVGTGSGILAILLNFLGWASVAAFDNDSHAEKVFTENRTRNHADGVFWKAQWQEDTSYDFIVANIIDGILLKLKPDFQKSLKPNGHLILTGILQERKDQFLEEMLQGWNLECLSTIEQEEWVGFHFRSRG